MKYFVERDTERQAQPPVDPTDTFFTSTATTVVRFSPSHPNIYNPLIFAIAPEVEMTVILQEIQYTRIDQNILLVPLTDLGYNVPSFMTQILLQPGHQNLCK
jgi:hypothetical protein